MNLKGNKKIFLKHNFLFDFNKINQIFEAL